MDQALLKHEIEPEFTDRQMAVLESMFGLLVEGGGKALTTAKIAKRANCSKESLYKWFGDRDGLLEAMVSYQASKVRAPSGVVAGPVRKSLEDFALDLLTVLSGEGSIAMNRLAIGEASSEASELGGLLLQRGRAPIQQRAIALLKAAKNSREIEFDDHQEAFQSLYGLIVGDGHIRQLLGDAPKTNLKARADSAIANFYKLYQPSY